MKRWFVVTCATALLVSAAARAESPARDYVASIRPSPELQAFLDRNMEELLRNDAKLRQSEVRVAILDLSHGDPPRLAHRDGETPIYPASVIKFVYLMAAYAWQEQAKLQIDATLDDLLTHMIRESSNQATQGVVARITDTQPGPELAPEAYAVFKQRRLTVDEWLRPSRWIASRLAPHASGKGQGIK